MKKIILLLLAMGVFVGVAAETKLDDASTEIAGRIIQAMGHKCGKVDKAYQIVGQEGTYVSCDNGYYAYRLTYLGSKYVVKVRY